MISEFNNASNGVLVVRPGERGASTENYQTLLHSLQVDEPLWLEMNWDDPIAAAWLIKHSGLPESSCQAVLNENTRPRSFMDEQGNLVLILRVINAKASNPEERLVSLRMVVGQTRVFSLCRYQPEALPLMRRLLAESAESFQPAQLITSLLRWIQEEINEEVFSLTEALGDIETLLECDKPPVDEISQARKRAGELQRYLAPQRAVLSQLRQQRELKLATELESDWRELANELQLSLEEVDMAINRLLIFQDEVRSTLNERTTRTLYLLSLVTFFFLPLSFITGFLGMNISFPWEASEDAFWILVAMITGIVLAQALLIRRLGWL